MARTVVCEQVVGQTTAGDVAFAPCDFLIVDEGGSITWASLGLPNLSSEDATAQSALKTSITMPGGASANLANVTIGTTGISFSTAGRYYFHIPSAVLKVLCVDPADTDLERVQAVANFISSCTVHSLADFHRVRPDVNKSEYTFAWATHRLFHSNSPLCFNCGEVSAFIGWVLGRLGFATREVGFNPGGHILMEVTLGDASKVCLDGDFGVAVLNSAAQIAADKPNDFANITLAPFSSKKDLTNVYGFGTGLLDSYAWQTSHNSASDIYGDAYYRSIYDTLATSGFVLREYVCFADGRCNRSGAPVSVPLP